MIMEDKAMSTTQHMPITIQSITRTKEAQEFTLIEHNELKNLTFKRI